MVIPMRIHGGVSRSFASGRNGDTWKTTACELLRPSRLRLGVVHNHEHVRRGAEQIRE